MTSIAFVGVGNMGGPMARNLLRAGYSVTAFDVNPAMLEPLLGAGAQSARSAAEAAKDTDVVITMLPAGQHVRSVYLDDGVLVHGSTGALLIDSSTIDIDSARPFITMRRQRRDSIFSTHPFPAASAAPKPQRSPSCAEAAKRRLNAQGLF